MALRNWRGELDRDPLPLLAQLAQGADDRHGSLEAIHAHNRAQPTGSLADLAGARVGGATEDIGGGGVLATLGRGMSTGGPGGGAPLGYARRVVRRGNRLLEQHDYGPGTESRFFERKNPGVLAAAVQRSQGARPNALQSAAMLSGAPQGQALTAPDEELLKLLLGNPTLRR